MNRFDPNCINIVTNSIIKPKTERPKTVHSPQFITLPILQGIPTTLYEFVPDDPPTAEIYSGPFVAMPIQGVDEGFPNNYLTPYDVNQNFIPTPIWTFTNTIYYTLQFNSEWYVFYSIETLNFHIITDYNNSFLGNVGTTSYYPTRGTADWPDNTISVTPSTSIPIVYVNLVWYGVVENSPTSFTVKKWSHSYSFTFTGQGSIDSGPSTTPIVVPSNIISYPAPIFPWVYTIQITVYSLVAFPFYGPFNLGNYFIFSDTKTLNFTYAPLPIWGTGAINYNYYIGNYYPPLTTDEAEIVTINQDCSGNIITPHGYLITNYYNSNTYYFKYLAYLLRIADNLITGGYRYYIELQPFYSKTNTDTEKLQFFQ